jgi:5-hydroxyisourate hydrolase
MGQLTTHVLDTMNGCPAAGMLVALYRIEAGQPVLIKQLALNHDGRADGPLLDETTFKTGTYRLLFEVAAYFRGRGVALPEPPFVDAVPIDFGMSNPLQHYHVPLLASPWAYSTYRGS